MLIKEERGQVMVTIANRDGKPMTAELSPDDVTFLTRSLRGAEKDYARGLEPDVELYSALRDGTRLRIEVTGTRASCFVQSGRFRATEELSVHAAVRQFKNEALAPLKLDKAVVRHTRA